MPSVDHEPLGDADVLKALGQLALAASQAEAYAAQGLYYLLADSSGNNEGGASIAAEFRSFNALYRLLKIGLQCDVPLGEIIGVATAEAQKRDRSGDPTLVAVFAGLAATAGDRRYLADYISRNPRDRAVDFLKQVKVLYDRRNECMHALGIEVTEHAAHLYKRKSDGTKSLMDAQHLTEACTQLRHYPGMTLASAIDAVSLELAMASLCLVQLPITVRWFRRRGTTLHIAPLVDHYVALSTHPLDEQVDALRAMETELQARMDESQVPAPTVHGPNGKDP